VVADIRTNDSTEAHRQAKVEIVKMELDSLQSVREAAADFLKRSKTLNVLIGNAGVMATPEGKTKDGLETQFGVNHVAHFLLFELLRPILLASSTPAFPSRVVCVSSAAHRQSSVNLDDLNFAKGGYDPWKAYGQSKTANIWMATEIERRYGSQGVHATAVHPGVIMTKLARHLDDAHAARLRTPEMQTSLKSAEQGAATTVWAAVGKEWANRGGKYLEDVGEAGARDPDVPITVFGVPGYMPWAYDSEGAKKLWTISLQLVGRTEDQ